MNQATKQPVEITQELIALYTTRKEVCAKLLTIRNNKELSEKIPGIISQSDLGIKELMNELSNYGDAVKSEVNRDSEYYVIWQNAQNGIDSLAPEEASHIFQKLEKHFQDYYENILQLSLKLPVSLNDILKRQLNRLAQT